MSNKVRATFTIDRDVLRLAKSKAALREVSLSFVIEAYLREFVKKNSYLEKGQVSNDVPKN